MALLDDLKRQAEIRRQEEERNQAERNRNLQAVHLALRNASRYFSELADSLNILNPEVRRSYLIDRTTRLDGLVQGDYRVRERRRTLEHRDYFAEVILRFDWKAASPLVLEREAPAQIKQLTDELHAYGFRFEAKAFRNKKYAVERVHFTIEPEFVASVRFTGDWDTGTIALSLKNVETLGQVNYYYDAAELDPVLFEEIAKLVLGRPNGLRDLGKHQELARTRPWVRPSRSADPVPSAEPEPEEEPEEEPGSKTGLLERLKSLLER